RDSANVTIENSVFRLWWKALTADSITNLTIRGNTFYNIRSDGIGLGVIDGGLIEANHMHNFRRLAGSNDHADMIQIQRSSNRRSTNIEIRDNILDMGAGDYTQTIW
ncbi:right-handed parallel beta-helix repeat-containing protein, partial [Ruegeria sp. NA]|nr:right-handed parallel beta-helix repeat-containing protein [Ruegeria sp. NA]